jgi:hypothetical protein
MVRNKALHGETFRENDLTQCSRINPLISHLYSRQLELPRPDRIMFRKPLAARLHQPLSVLSTLAFAAARVEPDSDLETERSDATPDHLSDDDEIPFGPIPDPDD